MQPNAVFIDVYVIRQRGGSWEVLILRRAAGTRCTGAWETVHGRVEPGESPVEAARRELLEETGLEALRWYNVSRVESFYLHRTDQIALVPVFAAVVAEGSVVGLSSEHDASEWISPEVAVSRFAWPRERRALADVMVLLGGGDAGRLEDVLRIS